MDKIFAMDKHVQKLCFDSLSRSLWFSIHSFLWVLNSVNSYKTFTATKGLPNNELWMLCEIRDIVECKVIGDKTYLCLNELNVKSMNFGLMWNGTIAYFYYFHIFQCCFEATRFLLISITSTGHSKRLSIIDSESSSPVFLLISCSSTISILS